MGTREDVPEFARAVYVPAMTFAADARVVSIHVSTQKGAPLVAIDDAELVAGQGIVGDKRFSLATKAKSQLTLIEGEALDAVADALGITVTPGLSRRNVITRGVALNHLVGQRFRLGGAVVVGHELCEPCGHLAKVVSRAFSSALVHRGGLRCEILESGHVRPGDVVGPHVPLQGRSGPAP